MPYGATGRHVIQLLENLVGAGHTVMGDNLYLSIPLAAVLATHLKKHYWIGTWRKKRGVSQCIIISNVRKHKPTRAIPKRSVRVAFVNGLDDDLYGIRSRGEIYIYLFRYG